MYVELPQLQILNLPKVVVKTKTGKVMVIVMMKIIIRDVNLMEEIVVDQLSRKIGAKLANVWILNLNKGSDSQLKEKEPGDVNFLIGKGTELAKMKITMLDVNGMVEIAADQMLTQDFAKDANVWIQIIIDYGGNNHKKVVGALN